MKDKYFFIESLGTLFEDVQLQKIFPDSKFFVDTIPKFPPGEIAEKYVAAKQKDGFDLAAFVNDHFILPLKIAADADKMADKPIIQHLHELWDILKRTPDQQGGTLIPLPYPYIVPGGRFREIYYWDSYFTMLGLQVSNRADIIQNMVDNFAYLIDEVGFIPNGNRTYYLGRSQPPFFSLMVKLLAEVKGEDTLLAYRAPLEKEYRFWMEGAEDLTEVDSMHRRVVKLQDGNILNRYWDDKDTVRPEAYREDAAVAQRSGIDPRVACRHLRAAAESGWDFSSRWFKDGHNIETIHTTDIIPVDLNCLLLHLEETLLRIYEMEDDKGLTGTFESKIKRRKRSIQRYCWDEVRKFYFDYDHIDMNPSRKYTLAGVFPLFFKVATPEQAEKVAHIIEEKFLQACGLVTTIYTSGQQWDAPNGWAPLQWIAYRGLRNYGFDELAKKIKDAWIKNCGKVYDNTGKMMEKYDVTDVNIKAGGGEYPNQDGFGWTNGVYLKMVSEAN